jgi:hypothetical protein
MVLPHSELLCCTTSRYKCLQVVGGHPTPLHPFYTGHMAQASAS